MRLQSKQQVTVRNVTIGGPDVLICLPLMDEQKPELLQQARDLAAMEPDLLEWRIDGFGEVENIPACMETLADLRSCIGSLPLIFTCRVQSEGGMTPLTQDQRLALIQAAIQSGHVEMVDVEICNDPAFLDAVKTAAKAKGTTLIFSFHDFEATPDEAFIHDKLLQAQEMGADVAKVAVMPHGYDDVLTLLNATLRARNLKVRIPMATMAMGAVGGVTRIAGGLFGSDMTFAMGRDASAPGQIHIERLRKAMSVVYGS